MSNKVDITFEIGGLWMSSSGLKRLKVWVEAKEFALLVYGSIIPALPPEEKWSLAQQIRRSAASIPANIAEGYGRFYYQANVQFCYNARGSLDETISHILLACELGYLSQVQCDSMIEKGDALAQLLNGYIAYLKKSKSGANELLKSPQINEENGSYSIDLNPAFGPLEQDDSPFSTLDSQQ